MDRIPAELLLLPQWVCSNSARQPINPKNGFFAKVNDSSTWADHATACSYALNHIGVNIGFVLAEDDPFTIIDLDDKPEKPASEEEKARFAKIIDYFDSYTERSIGGRGYHVVLKGKLPDAGGYRREHVEVYSHHHYLIFTGNVVRDRPIAERQAQLEVLVQQLVPAHAPVHTTQGKINGHSVELKDDEPEIRDQDIVEKASHAVNGEKFDKLCRGEVAEFHYPSQSEADYALLSILAFYTTDDVQVKRLFRMSVLGKREKATKDDKYLNTNLKKIRNRVSVEPDVKHEPIEVVVEEPEVIESIKFPQGVVGEIASYFMATAVRPVPEVALASALALVAGISGRCFNISNTGLNLYIALIARTGTGKESAPIGIDRLLAEVRKIVPMADQFIGPGSFASGQGLIKALDKNQCFVSILGEFGLLLQQLNDVRANANTLTLKRILLDLYTKSGWSSILRSTVYSDQEKNTSNVHAPAVTILGDSTPDAFYDGLTLDSIANGLIPRFNIIEYKGGRPARNLNSGCPPPSQLVDKMIDFCTLVLTMTNNNAHVDVNIDKEALEMLDKFDQVCDRKINTAGGEAEAQVWNRAHLKALKLCGIIAVGCNPHSAVVTKEIADWSMRFVYNDIEILSKKIKSGGVGTGLERNEHEVKRIINESTKKGSNNETAFIKLNIVPYDYIRRRVMRLKCFQEHATLAPKVLKEILENLVEAGELIVLDNAMKKEMGLSYSRMHFFRRTSLWR